MTISPTWFPLLVDLCVNLSAGWLAAAVAVIGKGIQKNQINWMLLFFNLGFGMLTMTVAFYLAENKII